MKRSIFAVITLLLAFLQLTPARAQQNGGGRPTGLQIVVIAGEDAINVIQPVGGVIVTGNTVFNSPDIAVGTLVTGTSSITANLLRQ